MKKLPLFEAIATLVGTIIGAGILGIPYVFARSGFLTGVLMLIVVGLAMCLMNLLFGEVALRTNGQHQLSGYAEIYLGKFFKHIMSLLLVFSIYGALLAYFIGEGQTLAAIFGGSPLLYSLIFYAVFAILIYYGLNIIKKSELIFSALLLLIIFGIALLAWDKINLANLSGFKIENLFYPYGVLLFACSGIVAVPQIRQILSKKERLIRKAIWWGCIIPPVIYFIFTFLAIGVMGQGITEVATVGLGKILGVRMLCLGNFFAFFAMATSFLTMGLALKDVYKLDYKLPNFWSWLLTMALPLIIFFLGARDFVKVINIVGAVGIGLNGVLHVLIYWAARKKGTRKPEYYIPAGLGNLIGIILIAIFIGGLIYALL